MTDHEAKRIAGKLQGEANQVAASAAAYYLAHVAASETDRVESGRAPGGADLASLSEGFEHLAGAVSLAVLVDEPALIAEEVASLEDLLAAHNIDIAGSSSAEQLLNSFLVGAAPFLDSAELSRLEDMLNRSREGRQAEV